jgi:hypothetical protein
MLTTAHDPTARKYFETNPAVSLLFLQRGMKEVSKSDCEDRYKEFRSRLGGRARRSALAGFRLCLIDHKGRHSIEEFPKDLLGLFR